MINVQAPLKLIKENRLRIHMDDIRAYRTGYLPGMVSRLCDGYFMEMGALNLEVLGLRLLRQSC